LPGKALLQGLHATHQTTDHPGRAVEARRQFPLALLQRADAPILDALLLLKSDLLLRERRDGQRHVADVDQREGVAAALDRRRHDRRVPDSRLTLEGIEHPLDHPPLVHRELVT